MLIQSKWGLSLSIVPPDWWLYGPLSKLKMFSESFKVYNTTKSVLHDQPRSKETEALKDVQCEDVDEVKKLGHLQFWSGKSALIWEEKKTH